MKEEYKTCPYCHNMVDKKDKQCPYCLKPLRWRNSSEYHINMEDYIPSKEKYDTSNNSIRDDKQQKNTKNLPRIFQTISDLSNLHPTKNELNITKKLKIISAIYALIILGIFIISMIGELIWK